jgi:mRNA interferase ChpB
MVFARGDIVHLEFDPASGREMARPHFALVVSPREFHRLGYHLVCPISQGEAAGARSAGYLVSLMGAGIEAQGNVHVHQVKSLDLLARRARFKERVPHFIVDDVLEKRQGIFA